MHLPTSSLNRTIYLFFGREGRQRQSPGSPVPCATHMPLHYHFLISKGCGCWGTSPRTAGAAGSSGCSTDWFVAIRMLPHSVLNVGARRVSRAAGYALDLPFLFSSEFPVIKRYSLLMGHLRRGLTDMLSLSPSSRQKIQALLYF